MKKLKIILSIAFLLFAVKVVLASTDSFQVVENIIISEVSFDDGSADLLILSGSAAEYFTYDNGVFSITNPSSTSPVKIASNDSSVKAIRVLNSDSEIVNCVKNNNLGTDYVSLPVNSGVYFIEPSNINLSNSLTYNSQCGAASCSSGYVISGSGASAICTTAPSSGGGGGGSVATASCSTVTYSDWGACINDFQFRTVVNKSPVNCSLNTEQQLSQQRVCQNNVVIKSEEESGNNEATISDSEISQKKESNSSDIDIKLIMKKERALIKNVDTQLTSRLSGKILLQVEEKGQAWYLSPTENSRHFLGRPIDAFSVMKGQGIGISNENLSKIPVSLDFLSGKDSDGDGLPDDFEIAIGTDPDKKDTDDDGFDDYTELLNGFDPLKTGGSKLSIDNNFSKKHAGKIFLQVERNGEAWYVNPDDNKRYFLGRPDDAFSIMRGLALGISNDNIRKIPVTK